MILNKPLKGTACSFAMKKEDCKNVRSLEKQLLTYNELKKEYLQIVKKIDSCEEEEQMLYQNIAAAYAGYLKKLESLLRLK